MSTTEANSILPMGTQQRLKEFQKRVRVIKLAEGILAGLFGLLISYLLVFSLDRIIDTPAILRGLILIIGSLGVGLFLPMVCHQWIWKTRHMEQVAKIVRRKFPSLGDQLLGVIELAKDPAALANSSALARAAIAQVDQVIQKRDLSAAMPKPLYRRWAIAAAVPCCLTVLALLSVPSAGWNAMARWLTPWKHIERYTFAQIDQLPREMIVPHGEEFDIQAHLRDSTEWSPPRGTVRVSTLRDAIRSPLEGQMYGFHVPARTEDSRLYVSIGDVRETIAIKPTSRPELKALHASVKLPDYLETPEIVKSDVRGGTISIVKGAIADFSADISRDLSKAQVDGHETGVNTNQVAIQQIPIENSQVLKLRWTDILGLDCKEEFNLKIQAINDEEPSILCQQENPLPVVLTTDVIRFDLSSKDDFGVKRIGLEWISLSESTGARPIGSKVVMAGGPREAELNTQATFCANTDMVSPQRIQIRAFAEDYFVDRPRSYSPAYIVHIMTPDEHVIWMTDQLRRWMAQADDVYEQEVRLHNVNRQLREMDAQTLALPATQRQIEQQIAAERANAGRLGAVTNQGSQLLAQALRNPEMNADQLETWAQVLNQLDTVANDKMPSIADLLRSGINSRNQGAPTPGSGNGALMAGNNKSTAMGKPGAPTKPSKQPNGPTLADIESGFNKPDESKDEGGDKKPQKASPSSLGPPQTVLMGGPSKKGGGGGDSPDDDLDEAVEDQTELLAEFARLRDQMQQIMDQLENSTFVKRFKAASRKQMEIATDLNRTRTRGFGQRTRDLGQSQTNVLELAKEREIKQSEVISDVQSDLDAYAGRKKESKLIRVLEEMRQMEVIGELKIVGAQIERNYTGEAIASAEFWADTLDRWAEEMVPPSGSGKPQPGKSNNLPPWAVLEILRLLEGEMDLRDETRSLEKSRSAIEEEDYLNRVDVQVKTQTELSRRAKVLVDDIKKLPEGEAKFGKAIGLVTAAYTIMDEVVTILKTPETGAPAIAAETEIIELLLQAKRANPKGGGAPGDTAGGGSSGTTDEAALALQGTGANANAKAPQREVQQSSGGTTKQLPEEFRTGLDAFFNAMDQK